MGQGKIKWKMYKQLKNNDNIWKYLLLILVILIGGYVIILYTQYFLLILQILVILIGGYVSIFYTQTGFHLRVSIKKYCRCKSDTKLRYTDPDTYDTFDLIQKDNTTMIKIPINTEIGESLPNRKWIELFNFEKKSSNFKKYGDQSVDYGKPNNNCTNELLKILEKDIKCKNIANILNYWYKTSLERGFIMRLDLIKKENDNICILENTLNINKERSIDNINTYISQFDIWLEENNYNPDDYDNGYFNQLIELKEKYNENNETILEIDTDDESEETLNAEE